MCKDKLVRPNTISLTFILGLWNYGLVSNYRFGSGPNQFYFLFSFFSFFGPAKNKSNINKGQNSFTLLHRNFLCSCIYICGLSSQLSMDCDTIIYYKRANFFISSQAFQTETAIKIPPTYSSFLFFLFFSFFLSHSLTKLPNLTNWYHRRGPTHHF